MEAMGVSGASESINCFQVQRQAYALTSLSLKRSSIICLRVPPSQLFSSSRPFHGPRCFFQEEAESIHGQLSRQPSEILGPPRWRNGTPIKEGDELPLHSGASPHFKAETEAEGVVTEEASVSDGANQLKDGYRTTRVADRLIEVFLVERTTPEEWRKLLVFSKEWSNIRMHFFTRCRARAEQEADPEMKGNLLKLCRKLNEVDQDVERHNELVSFVKENVQDIDSIVARRRKDFTTDFFQHLELLYQASHENSSQQQDLAKIAQKCIAAVDAYDKMTEEEAAVDVAQRKFDDILSSPSLDVARNKIDELAKRNQLDSTLMLLITKAWAASKESTMMKDEVKDILYHLYMTARGNLQRLVPKEVRIMRHLLSLEDPKEQLQALTDAFSPGAELQGQEIDFLYTTPEQLHNWIMIVLNAYYNNQKSSLMKSAQELMSPTTIKRLEILKRTIEQHYL